MKSTLTSKGQITVPIEILKVTLRRFTRVHETPRSNTAASWPRRGRPLLRAGRSMGSLPA
jgi:hypothetical protein